MNLSDITTKPWILALFKRDDGERFLLGDGYYDFKDSLQHFQPNTMANDIVELQGTDGQLLAGQVRRGASQSFDGIIGDGTTTKKVVEERRRDFLMFFRKKHFYTVIYIFCDGTAIKRERGYLVDAPSVPEIRQLAPSYHVALNFENVNYYEYREDSDGNEIYSNTRNVVISTLMTGGLIWDNLGAVSEAIQWANEQTAQGAYITINDGLIHAPMSLTQLNGNATQSGTPSPDSPVSVQVVTGENEVMVCGKNLLNTKGSVSPSASGLTLTRSDDGAISWEGTVSGTYAILTSRIPTFLRAGTYTFSTGAVLPHRVYLSITYTDGTTASQFIIDAGSMSATFTASKDIASVRIDLAGMTNGQAYSGTIYPQLELGTATAYEPYKGTSYPVKLASSLINYNDFVPGSMNSGNPSSTAKYRINNGSLPIPVEPNTEYVLSANLVSPILGLRVGIHTCAEDGTFIADSGWQQLAGGAYTFTTGANVYFLKLVFSRSTTSSNVTTTTENQTVVADANEFFMASTVTLEKSGADVYAYELAKISTYQDRIYKDEGKWYVEKQVGKVVLDENTAFVTYPYGTNSYATAVSGMANTPTSTQLVMSDRLYGVAYDDRTQAIQNMVYSDGGQAGQLDIRNTSWASSSDLTTWLSTHPTTVYYALATPTTTEITDATLLAQLNHIYKLYGGVNNISIVGTGAQGTMEISYFTELQPGGGFEWEDGGTGGATIINVEGVDAASPIWTIKGSATNPTLTNITTGQTITWTGTVPSGQTLIIDMDKQTATMEGANVFEFISGDWLDLAPGINRVTYSVLGTDQPSTLSWNNIVG